MMLSPQAARMGTVYTTLRKIGCNNTFASFGGGDVGKRGLVTSLSRTKLGTSLYHRQGRIVLGGNIRTQSSAAFNHNDDEQHETFDKFDVKFSEKIHPVIFQNAQTGHAAAAELRAAMLTNDNLINGENQTVGSSIKDEPWRINLGRGEDNAWLMGPRKDEEWFTGVSPGSKVCPGVDEYGAIRSLPLPNLSKLTRESIKNYFDNSWTLYETLFAGLKGEEGFYRPPVHGLRHPQIFYYGHTACLYINKLRVAGVLKNPVNPYFESIFEVGVDEMLWDDMHKNDMLWPMVSEVHEYRKQVYKVVANIIENHPSLDDSNGPIKVDQSHPMWSLFMGFEHDRIHLETSSVLFREMPSYLVQTPINWPPLHPSAFRHVNDIRPSNPIEGYDYPTNRMITVERPQSVDLGKPADFPSYGWDNEYGERTVDVPPFQASEHMITNGEYWHFVADGGYRNKKYWSDDGWAWRTYRNMKWPFFWEPAGPAGSNEFQLRTIFESIPMAWDWPVDVNYYEAKAYCNWKTAKDGSPTSKPYRVLTEAEHHIIRHRSHNLEAARKNVDADKVMVASGKHFPEGSTGANLNMAFSSQNPVDFFAPSETGHRDPTGNAWEWTEDHFNPLKGFEVHHVYDDFSTPCFDGKHSMIVGGSFMSTGDEASVFARFHFRPHFLQHSGFRLVASNYEAPAKHLFATRPEHVATAGNNVTTSAVESCSVDNFNDNQNVYESVESLHMYLGLHYPKSGTEELIPPILLHNNTPNHGLFFPQRVAKILDTLLPADKKERALDIGCAVGGSSFELAKKFNHVDAFDFSLSFIHAAKRMQDSPQDVTFKIPIEADLVEEVKAIHDDGVTAEVRAKVNFFTGDACNMDEMQATKTLQMYDGVIMSNLLCRLPNPQACLQSLPNIVKAGGVIVMVTPFSWLTEFTPRGKWLGGFVDPVSKEPIYSKDVLQKVMESNGFEKIYEEDIPLIIREHQRKYQYIVSLATGWRKSH